jgi:hypothetical protein
MTWRELKNFINKRARDNKLFLDTDINLYDFSSGEEYPVDITELSCSDDEVEDGSITNWVAFLSINEKDLEDETEETSIN